MTLVRLACPRCGYSPGEFLPGAVIGCRGGNSVGGRVRPKHPLVRLLPTNPLPLDDNTKETR